MSYVVQHEGLKKWVQQVADMTQPDDIYWCDGTKEEYDRLMAEAVAGGAAIPLAKRPNSFLFRSDAAMWPASRTGPTSAPHSKKMLARPITGSRLTSSRQHSPSYLRAA